MNTEAELHRALDDAAAQVRLLRETLEGAIDALEYYEELPFGESDGGQTARAALAFIRKQMSK